MKKFDIEKALEATLVIVIILAFFIIIYFIGLLIWKALGIYSIPVYILGALATGELWRYIYKS